MNFIKTRDESVAQELMASNYTLVCKDASGMYTFMNNGQKTFSVDEKKKMAFTNMMTMERKE